jgi:hypothetical protein
VPTPLSRVSVSTAENEAATSIDEALTFPDNVPFVTKM